MALAQVQNETGEDLEISEIHGLFAEVRAQPAYFNLILRIRHAGEDHDADVTHYRVPANGTQDGHAIVLGNMQVKDDYTGFREVSGSLSIDKSKGCLAVPEHDEFIRLTQQIEAMPQQLDVSWIIFNHKNVWRAHGQPLYCENPAEGVGWLYWA
jgi:hypothetical protein